MVSRKRRHSRSVSTRPGLMELTCTPSVLPMSAIALVKATQAAFTELPMVNGASGSLPPMPAMVTSEPCCAFSIGQASRVSRTWAKNFSAKPSCPFGVGQLEEVAALGGAGVVDQDVEPAEFAARRLDQRLFRAFLAQVEHRDGGLAALGLDRRRDRLERRLVPPGDQEVAAFVGQRQGDALPDAAARPRDEGDLATQPQFHIPALRLLFVTSIIAE